MKILYTSIILYLSSFTSVFAITTCHDAMSVSGEAKSILHSHAQKRAQSETEEILEKKIINPYMTAFGHEGTPETMASLIELYWCESKSTPLHSAYYRYYSSNKVVFSNLKTVIK